MSEEKKHRPRCGYVKRTGKECGDPAAKGAQCSVAKGNKERCTPHALLAGHAICTKCREHYFLLTCRQTEEKGICSICRVLGKKPKPEVYETDVEDLQLVETPDIVPPEEIAPEEKVDDPERPKNAFIELAVALRITAEKCDVLSASFERLVARRCHSERG